MVSFLQLNIFSSEFHDENAKKQSIRYEKSAKRHCCFWFWYGPYSLSIYSTFYVPISKNSVGVRPISEPKLTTPLGRFILWYKRLLKMSPVKYWRKCGKFQEKNYVLKKWTFVRCVGIMTVSEPKRTTALCRFFVSYTLFISILTVKFWRKYIKLEATNHNLNNCTFLRSFVIAVSK